MASAIKISRKLILRYDRVRVASITSFYILTDLFVHVINKNSYEYRNISLALRSSDVTIPSYFIGRQK